MSVRRVTHMEEGVSSREWMKSRGKQSEQAYHYWNKCLPQARMVLHILLLSSKCL